MKNLAVKNFKNSESGGLSIEAVLITPILIWAVMAIVVFWDGFRTSNVNQKATYTIADMLSRETIEIDSNYLTAVHELHGYLNDDVGGTSLRVTVIRYSVDPETLQDSTDIVWSAGLGGLSELNSLASLIDRVPSMAPGEQLILVEGELDWEPLFTVGVPTMHLTELAIARPRFAPQLMCHEPEAFCPTAS